MRQVDRGGGSRAFRMDDRAQRLLVEAGDDGLGFLGWEVGDGAALDALANRLEAARVPVSRGSAALTRNGRSPC